MRLLCNQKDGLPAFPINRAYMPAIVKRIELAQKIDVLLRKSSQVRFKTFTKHKFFLLNVYSFILLFYGFVWGKASPSHNNGNAAVWMLFSVMPSKVICHSNEGGTQTRTRISCSIYLV